MAVSPAIPLQSRFSSSSALSLPVDEDDFERQEFDLTCSPFSLSCAAARQNHSASSRHESTLTLRPARYDACSARYQNGQITPTSPPLCMIKADKTPFPPPLPNAWSWSPENSSFLASLPPTRSEEGPSNWYGSTLQSPEELLRWQRRHSSVSKPLLSPIKFSPNVQLRTTGQVEELPPPDQFIENELELSCDDANSFHSSDWDLTAPSRRLSYGEPLDVIEARSLRQSTGSTKLPSEARWGANDKSCGTWVDDIMKAQAQQTYHSEPSRRKNRLWLDLVEDDEEIEEAVRVPDHVRLQALRFIQHATAMTTSPSKPRVISIRPRRATTESSPDKATSPSVSLFQPGATTFLPETPPRSRPSSVETPERPQAPLNGILTTKDDPSKQERQQQAFNKIRSRTTWSTSPPFPDGSPPQSSDTIRRVVTLSPKAPISPAISRPATPPPISVNTGLKLSELTTWILTELESATEDDVNSRLKLDSSVIQQLRLPPKQRRIPRQSPLIPARSSFSASQGPLTSHTSPSQFAPHLFESSNPPSPSTNSLATGPDATTSILTRIFPLAPRPTLSHLLATILAHQFVSTIHPPLLQQTTTAITSPFAAHRISKHSPPTAPPAQIDGLPEHIPSKARAMLGLPPLSPPGNPKDGRPPLPSLWRRVEKMEWRYRVGVLEGKLQGSVKQIVRELVGGDEWKSGEKWLDMFVSAVGESVRMGEALGVAL